jgi:hypothetical protein
MQFIIDKKFNRKMPICITDEKLKLIIIYGEHAIPGENLINYYTQKKLLMRNFLN